MCSRLKAQEGPIKVFNKGLDATMPTTYSEILREKHDIVFDAFDSSLCLSELRIVGKIHKGSGVAHQPKEFLDFFVLVNISVEGSKFDIGCLL
jgi:hypothetical protein